MPADAAFPVLFSRAIPSATPLPAARAPAPHPDGRGRRGRITQEVPGGYDDGAADFASALAFAAEDNGWHVTRQFVTVPRTARAGEGGVTFSDEVDVLTVTSAT